MWCELWTRQYSNHFTSNKLNLWIYRTNIDFGISVEANAGGFFHKNFWCWKTRELSDGNLGFSSMSGQLTWQLLPVEDLGYRCKTCLRALNCKRSLAPIHGRNMMPHGKFKVIRRTKQASNIYAERKAIMTKSLTENGMLPNLQVSAATCRWWGQPFPFDAPNTQNSYFNKGVEILKISCSTIKTFQWVTTVVVLQHDTEVDGSASKDNNIWYNSGFIGIFVCEANVLLSVVSYVPMRLLKETRKFWKTP